jgi:hypothetical protein
MLRSTLLSSRGRERSHGDNSRSSCSTRAGSGCARESILGTPRTLFFPAPEARATPQEDTTLSPRFVYERASSLRYFSCDTPRTGLHALLVHVLFLLRTFRRQHAYGSGFYGGMLFAFLYTSRTPGHALRDHEKVQTRKRPSRDSADNIAARSSRRYFRDFACALRRTTRARRRRCSGTRKRRGLMENALLNLLPVGGIGSLPISDLINNAVL